MGDAGYDVKRLGEQNLEYSSNELIRLEALRSFHLLDSLPEAAFDRVTNLARQLFKVPICLVSLVDVDRQWFKSNPGLEGVRETCREHAFCHYTVKEDGPDVFVVLDSKTDTRFEKNPLVTGFPRVIFYAGAALCVTWKGNVVRVGSLCLIDHEPRETFSIHEKTQLTQLAAIVVDLIEARNQDALTASTREMQKLVLCVAHEFKTPLAGIRLGVNLLQEAAAVKDTQSFDILSHINSSLDLMQLLIDQKLGSFGGVMQRREAPVVVADLVRNIQRVAKLMILQVEPTYEIAFGCPEVVYADTSMLTQIAAQFLSNAVRYTTKGFVRLRVSHVAPQTVNGLVDPGRIAGIRIEVADSGPGVPESILPRVFDAFVKGPTACEGTENQSLGLGLYCVQQLVLSVQGRYGLQNTYPGCVQWSEIPCAALSSESPNLGKRRTTEPDTDTPYTTSPESLPRNVSQKLSMTDTTAPDGERPCVLVIEDAPMLRKMMCRILAVSNYDSEEAANGQIGLEMLMANPDKYILAFVDFVMPVMDGIEATRQFRAWEASQKRSRRVVLWGVSANAEECDVKQAMDAGMDGFTPKPINTTQIRRVLQSAGSCQPVE